MSEIYITRIDQKTGYLHISTELYKKFINAYREKCPDDKFFDIDAEVSEFDSSTFIVKGGIIFSPSSENRDTVVFGFIDSIRDWVVLGVLGTKQLKVGTILPPFTEYSFWVYDEPVEK